MALSATQNIKPPSRRLHEHLLPLRPSLSPFLSLPWSGGPRMSGNHSPMIWMGALHTSDAWQTARMSGNHSPMIWMGELHTSDAWQTARNEPSGTREWRKYHQQRVRSKDTLAGAAGGLPLRAWLQIKVPMTEAFNSGNLVLWTHRATIEVRGGMVP